MKSTATPKLAKQTYPCLMVENRTGDVVLFCSSSTGMVIVQGTLDDNADEVGTIGKNWKAEDPDIFSPFTGTITLSND